MLYAHRNLTLDLTLLDNVMTIHLFTTTDISSRRGTDMSRYLNSLAEQTGEAHLVVHILLQNCPADHYERFAANAPQFCKIKNIAGRMSLSEARNLMLRDLFAAHMPGTDDIIGFPDDDCWLPHLFTSSLAAVFESKANLGLLICRVSLQPDSLQFDVKDLRSARTAEVVRLSTSNSIFIRGNLLREIGEFDLNLGLGTAARGGEDTDYAIRAFLRAQYTGLIDRYLVGHREQDQASAAGYYDGSLQVLARHARKRPALLWEFGRKLMVGAYFVIHRRISYKKYAASLFRGIRVFSTS